MISYSKFKKGDILQAKKGASVSVINSLATYAQINDIKENLNRSYVLDTLKEEKICLVVNTYDKLSDLAPPAYECIIDGKRGFIIITEEIEDLLVKVD